MLRSFLATTLIATSLMAADLQAQTTATPGATPAPAANAVDPGAVQALKTMGTYLQTLKRFEVTTDLTAERVLADGQKLQHTASAELQVVRPNMLRAVMRSARSRRELIYDGKNVTLYTPAQKYYSTVAFTDNLGELVRRLQERFAVEIPLSDMFLWGSDAAPAEHFESAMNAGQDFVGDELCDHYAFRQGLLDWQIWITAGDKPLPRKLAITNRGDDARPQSVSLIEWNVKPTFSNSVFKFVPPSGAKKIEILPRPAK